MFSLRRDVLMLNLRPAHEFRPIPPAADRRVWEAVSAELRTQLRAEAERALAEPIAPLSAGLWLQGAPYMHGNTKNLDALEALMLGACAAGPERYIKPLADRIWALLEQTSWAAPIPHDPVLPDELNSRIDLYAARTAATLALAHSLLSAPLDHVSPMIRKRIEREQRRRIFEPLMDERSDALQFSYAQIPCTADALMAAVLLVDQDDQSRWLCMRRLVGLVERFLSGALPDGGCLAGLERQVRDTCALNNLLFMLSLCSGGAVELRDEPDFVNMAMLPVQLHVGSGWFVNPGGDSPRPCLAPDSLFRLGDGVRSAELCQLAAYLNRPEAGAKPAEPTDEPLMHRLLNALYRTDFLREPARLVQRAQVRLPEMQLLSARMGPFYAALAGGANYPGYGHLDVGDLCLFYQGDPVIIDPGFEPGADFHSVPRIDLSEQGYLARPPEEGVDARFDDSLTMLSIGIAHAYPRSAQLQSWQRSLMLSAFEGSVRLMDVFDFDYGVKKQLAFRFLTPRKPEPREGCVLLGNVQLGWEGDLLCRVEPLDLANSSQRALWRQGFYRITLTTPEPVPSAKYAFSFRAVGA